MIEELLSASRQLRRAVEEPRSTTFRRDYRLEWPALWQAIDAVLASDPEPPKEELWLPTSEEPLELQGSRWEGQT